MKLSYWGAALFAVAGRRLVLAAAQQRLSKSDLASLAANQDLLNDLADRLAPRQLQTTRTLQQDTSGGGGTQEQGSGPSCNEIVDTWTQGKVLEQVQVFLNAADATTASFVLPLIEHGIQVRKVCAACSDYDALSSTSFCSPQHYGSNVTMSGLAVFPLTNSNESAVLEPGNLVLSIYGRGTRVASEPSTEWTSTVSTTSSPEVVAMAVITAITGSVSLLPDFMGYGESLGSAYRSYIVNKGYQTSTIPLIYRVDEILRTETNSSRLSNGVVVSGYSEGGYAAVSMTTAVEEIGMDVLVSNVGGAPLAIASTQLLRSMARMDNGSFPQANYFYQCLLGSAYSSTNPDVLNYGKNNDMLNPLYRNATVLLTNSANTTSDTLNTFIYDLPGEDPTVIMNPIAVNWTRDALLWNETHPCNSSIPALSAVAPVALCAALMDNDLTQTVLSSTRPVHFCHSPDDELVDFGNVPNTSLNSNLDLIVASGSHVVAGGFCLTQNLLWYLSPEYTDFDPATAPVFAGTSDGGGSGGDGGSGTPAGSPTKSPTETTSSGPASWSSGPSRVVGSILTGLLVHHLFGR